MNETVDGEYQAMKARDGAYVREKFFGKSPEALELVSSMSDKDIWRLNRGGHDPHKVFAAYDKATKNKGSPTVIIAKTIKGYGMGKSGESVNTTHQTKKLDVDDLMYYRDRFDVPLTDEQVRNIEYFKPGLKYSIFLTCSSVKGTSNRSLSVSYTHLTLPTICSV